MANLPTFGRNETQITLREGEVPLANFDDGMNRPASNAPGIGINTAGVNPKESDWTLLDQNELARAPQVGFLNIAAAVNSQGSMIASPIRAADEEAMDYNDELYFVTADQAAVPGAVYDTVSGAVNRGTENIEIGDRAWGTVPVA